MTAATRWLAAAVVALLCAALLGGAMVVRAHGDRADAQAQQDRYGAALAAATDEATAFVNLRYDRARASVAAVAAGATGAFRKQYDDRADAVVRVLRQQRSVMVGQVVSAAVVTVDARHATVLVATTGAVSNRRSKGKQVARSFRLRVDLVEHDGRWLTTDLRFVRSPA